MTISNDDGTFYEHSAQTTIWGAISDCGGFTVTQLLETGDTQHKKTATIIALFLNRSCELLDHGTYDESLARRRQYAQW